jgi:hypothetical protein
LEQVVVVAPVPLVEMDQALQEAPVEPEHHRL